MTLISYNKLNNLSVRRKKSQGNVKVTLKLKLTFINGLYPITYISLPYE